MKKTYKKPDLYVEYFQLSQTIATGCGENLDWGMANVQEKENCGWYASPDFEIFMDYGICDWPTEEFEGICYNAPEGGYNVFGS